MMSSCCCCHRYESMRCRISRASTTSTSSLLVALLVAASGLFLFWTGCVACFYSWRVFAMWALHLALTVAKARNRSAWIRCYYV